MDRREQVDRLLGDASRVLVDPKAHVQLPEWLDAITWRHPDANLMLLDAAGEPQFVLLHRDAYLAFSQLCAVVGEIVGRDPTGQTPGEDPA